MNIKWDPNAEDIIAGMVKRLQTVVDRVVSERLGEPVDKVKPALAAAWAGANEGASITEPDLTTVATLISEGKRVWVTDDGRIMADD